MHAAPEAAEVWILTDGKAGDEMPLVGVAEALGRPYQARRVRPRRLYALLAPFGPADPADAAGDRGPLSPPYPRLCMATGRRAVPYLRALKRRTPGTATVIFKDPRVSNHGADLVFVQEHDRLRGERVIVNTTSPHRFSKARLAEARAERPEALVTLSEPRVAVLVGGDSRHHRFRPEDVDRFVASMQDLARQGVGLMITVSRRTPAQLAEALSRLAERPNAVFWGGGAENPLLHYLAFADYVVATADSTNMIGEAAATGRPIHVFHPAGGHRKTAAFLAALARQATIRPFPGRLGGKRYAPVDATPAIAREIERLAFPTS